MPFGQRSIGKILTLRTSLLLMVMFPLLGPATFIMAKPPAGYKLVWSDEFNGKLIDTNKWEHWLPGKRRDALNVTNAVSVKDGHLTITTFSKGGRNYTGMISTRGKFEPIRGYWEARIRFDDSPGMWSAFWLQSPTMGRPIGDPAAAGVEIDICEHRATGAGGEKIASNAQHTLHWDGYRESHKSKGHLTPDLKLGTGFHTYGLEWTVSAYRFYVDGKLTWTFNQAISGAPEFAILSSEVKNGSWAGRIPSGGYGDLKQSKTRMVVDYIRYYSGK